eukprot:5270541-Karenia_brevis.AAC.1
MSRVPELAGMVFSEFQNKSTSYWQRANGCWRRQSTTRGGFQGKRLVTLLFCGALEASRDHQPVNLRN